MARTAQTANPRAEKSKWRQRQYSDHEGNSVILGKKSLARQFNEPEDNYAHRMQLYSAAPIHPEDYNVLYRFLFARTDAGPFIEIYTSPQPNAISCVEHQRREIAYRKKLHAEADQKSESNYLPPLIAKRQFDSVPEIPDGGACLFLTSDSLLARRSQDMEDADRLGPPPFTVYFNRQCANEIRKIDLISRIEELRRSVLSFTKYGNQVLPEALEILADRSSRLSYFDEDFEDLWETTGTDFWGRTLEVASGLEERPLEQQPWDFHRVQKMLEKQHRGDLGMEIQLTKGSDETGTTITATNYESGENDLQYVIDVLFLAGLAENISLLETTARIFTTCFLMELASMKKTKKVRFQFRIPGPSLSSVMEFPHSFPVGVFQHVTGSIEKRRVVPVDRNEIPWLYKPTWDKFAVVLDKPAFITEPGVLFMIHDPPDPENEKEEDITCRRSTGMTQVADRLSMLAIEDKRGFEDLRWLTDTEFREVSGMSMEEYISEIPTTRPSSR